MDMILTVEHLVKKYKEVVAVNDISFAVKKGEPFCISRTKWSRQINNNQCDYNPSGKR